MEQKKLERSLSNRKLCGVCGGIASYFNVDATLIRLLWVVFSLLSIGIIIYIVAAIVMPEQLPE